MSAPSYPHGFVSVADHNIRPAIDQQCGRLLNCLLENGGGRWFVPPGTYSIEETIRLSSGTTLLLHPDARLRLADGAAKDECDYLITNANPTGGDRDIHVEGGTFDGNQVGNPRPEGLFDPGFSGAMLHFDNVRDLTLRNTTLRDAEAYYARFTGVEDFTIEDIRFDSFHIRPNNDGIHLGGDCSRGIIRRLRAETPGVTGDDMVALNADDALTRTEVRGMRCGPIRDILIEDVIAHSCHSFVRLLSVVSPIENIRICGLRGGCEVAALNADGARGCRVPVFDESNPPFPDGVGLLRSIHVEDLRVHKTVSSHAALIDLQERLEDVQITGFERVVQHDAAPSAPSLRLRHLILRQGEVGGKMLSKVNTLSPNPPFEDFLTRGDLRLNPA